MGQSTWGDVTTTKTDYVPQQTVSQVQVPVQRQVPRTVQERSTSFVTQTVQEEVQVPGTQYTTTTHQPPPVCTTTQAPPVCSTTCAPVACAQPVCAQPVVRTASYGCGVP